MRGRTREIGDGETREDSSRRRVPASPRQQYIALCLILIVAAYFRFSGLDWDRGYLFHPDERQVLLVTTRIQIPASLAEFFSADSPLNPKFFSYGSLPIYLLRALGVFAPDVIYPVPWRDNILVSYALLGRALSGLFDLGTIVFIFLLGRRLYSARVGLLAAASIAVTVLHIQLSHFYAVDTLLVFFIVATMYFAALYAETSARRDQIALALAFGFAMATKVSAFVLVAPIIVAALRAEKFNAILRGVYSERSESAQNDHDAGLRKKISRILRRWLASLWQIRQPLRRIFLLALAVFLVAEPYALLDPIRFFGQTGTEGLIARGWMDVPFTRQYADTIPYAYQIAQSAEWSMGLPLGVAAWLGSALFAWQWWRMRGLGTSPAVSEANGSVEVWRAGFVLSFAFVYFAIIGAQYAKHLRYLLPLIPFLYLMAARIITKYESRITNYFSRFTLYALFAWIASFSLWYSFAFAGIYAREHPWLTISRWIYQNIPAGATLAVEHWDDQLPVSLRTETENRAPIEYSQKILPLYDADDAAKLELIADALASTDYIILASQRLYGVIPRLPERYPLSSRYYRRLFDGALGFELAAYARNDPQIGGITITDDAISSAGLTSPPLLKKYQSPAQIWEWSRADESFTVYDHPMPLVFKKTRVLTRAELVRLLSSK